MSLYIYILCIKFYDYYSICLLNDVINFSLQYSRSLLHTAAEKGHVGIINTLITHGANVDTMDKVYGTYNKYLCI